MSKPKIPVKGALIMALFLSRELDEAAVRDALQSEFGPYHYECEPFKFDYSSYYESEMGSGLLRAFCVFEKLFEQGELVQIKHRTNEIEKQFLVDGKRTVNLDPGMLTANRFVLATGKDAPHRIYLGDGIFAEVTLVFEFGRFKDLTWTYPDYKDTRTLAFLMEARKYYLQVLRLNRAVEQTKFSHGVH